MEQELQFGIDLIEQDGEVLADSRRVAALLEIEHRSVFRLLQKPRFGVMRFEIALPVTGSKGGQPEKYALLTERQALILLTFVRNTEASEERKTRLVDAFLSYRAVAFDSVAIKRPETAIEWAQAFIGAETERIRLAEKIAEDEPKVDYFDRIVAAKRAVDMETAAKALSRFKMGRNKLYAFLRLQKILKDDNIPYQDYMQYFVLKTIPVKMGGIDTSREQTFVRVPEGMDFVDKRLSAAGYPRYSGKIGLVVSE